MLGLQRPFGLVYNRVSRGLESATGPRGDRQSFVRLQNAIVDPRYAEAGWRTVQNFVGQTKSDFTDHLHFVCPKPEDVPSLMRAWMQMLDRLYRSPVDAVCAARAAFTPAGLLFPVSAVMFA